MTMYNPQTAKYKLWVAFKDGSTRVYYSLTNYDRQRNDKSIHALIDRFINGAPFSGKYKTAIIYDNQTNREIKRFDETGKEI